MKKLKKSIITIIISSIALLYLIIVSWPDKNVRVIFCDVGQGDAILVTIGFTQVLIDAGPNDSVSGCLSKHIPFWDQEIELAVLSHADKDHLGGFESVLNQFFVKKMLVSELGKKTSVFNGFREAVLKEKEQGMELVLVNKPNHLKIDNNINFESLITRVEGLPIGVYNSENTEAQLWDKIEEQEAWMKDNKVSLNTLSIVNIMEVGKVKFLFTGDLDLKGEQALMDEGLIGDMDVLKVGHHGSKTSTGDAFLQVVLPEISVIGVGKNNSYKHPSPQVEAKLSQIGSKFFRTDSLGEVVVVTDGERYWLE